jgi:hypothetical protein
MPLPKPKKKEKQGDFISRCAGDTTMNKDFPETKQRVAVCYSQWKEAKASAMASFGEGVNEILFECPECVQAAQKTYGGKKRSDLKDSDFLFPATRSFPIVSPQDVRDAISNYGRMGGKMSYDTFIKKLYNKARSKGQEFVNAIPEKTRKEHKLTASEDSLEEYKNEFIEMALGSIAVIADHAKEILDNANDPKVKENLSEPFLQQQIALAEDYMMTISNYVMYAQESDEEMDLMEPNSNNLPE